MESMTLQEHEAHNVMLLPVHRPATITQHRAFSALAECLAAFILSEPVQVQVQVQEHAK